MNIAVFGLQRSGNHPIINWLCRQLPGLTVYYNDIRKAGADPYEKCTHISFYRDGLPAELKYYRQDSEKPKLLKTDNIVHTYEDFKLSRLDRHGYYKRYENIQPIEILILRDPYNWSASRIQSKKKVTLRLWLTYAKEFVGETDFLRFGKTPINYNKWFSDRTYRDSWLATLGLENYDRGVKEVSVFGGGSSFDRVNFDGKAQEMKVLDRWKEMELDKNSNFMEKLGKHPKIREYAKKIFRIDFPL